MFHQQHAGERGQSLILVALASVALFAFAALAVDGSLLYSTRRIAQNAADGAAVSGTYKLHRVRKDQEASYSTVEWRQDEILAEIRKIAASHGVPDVKENVHGYFTDEEGNLLPDENNPCRMPDCGQEVNWLAWGVYVEVAKPYDTHFAGVIGWHQMTAHANAIAVVHAASRADDMEYWAVFSRGQYECKSNYPTSLRGSDLYIIGNIHANTSVNMQSSAHTPGDQDTEGDPYNDRKSGSGLFVNGDVTYVDDCNNCMKYKRNGSITGKVEEVEPIGLTVPSYGDFESIASRRVEEQGVSSCNNNMLYGGVCTGSYTVDKGQVGHEDYPYTYIDGDLNIKSETKLHGLVLVTGDFKVRGNDNHGTFTVVTDGQIDVGGKDNFMDDGWQSGGFCSEKWEEMYNKPFRDPEEPELENNGIRFFANYYSGTCSGALRVGGSKNFITGSLVAPRDGVEFGGARSRLCGNIIGDWNDISGARTYIYYRRDFFPPQPDLIELLQ